jgi:hypothetical protein
VDVLKRLNQRQIGLEKWRRINKKTCKAFTIHAIVKQMANSSAIIKRHSSKLTATMMTEKTCPINKAIK